MILTISIILHVNISIENQLCMLFNSANIAFESL